MSSSSEAAVRPVERPELGAGPWTRLGGAGVAGDAATEATLGELAEQARRAARAQGYAVGWAEGRREALAEVESLAAEQEERARAAEQQRSAEHRDRLAALDLAAAELRAAVADVRDALAAQATELALAVTEELVGRELELAPAADVVRRTLAALPEDTSARVRLHPDVLEGDHVAQLVERGLVVVPDPGLEPHDAVVETDEALTDLRVAPAIERLREVLR